MLDNRLINKNNSHCFRHLLPDEHSGAIEARLDAAVAHRHDVGNLVVGLVLESAEPVDSLVFRPQLRDGVLLDADEFAQFARVVADGGLLVDFCPRCVFVESAHEGPAPQVV